MAASPLAFDMRLAVVVMGVSGSGKTSVADGLARRLGLRLVDADDLHAPNAVAKMRAGHPLTDADRWPWLARVGRALADAAASPAGVVVACSALQRAYRDRLRQACPGLRFVFLDGAESLIAQRLRQRSGHYMPASLLSSQIQALQPPSEDEPHVLRVDIAQPLDRVIEQACAVALDTPAPGASPSLAPGACATLAAGATAASATAPRPTQGAA